VLTKGGETRIKRNRALLELWLSTDLARSEPVAEFLLLKKIPTGREYRFSATTSL